MMGLEICQVFSLSNVSKFGAGGPPTAERVIMAKCTRLQLIFIEILERATTAMALHCSNLLQGEN
jgi:hypothetical protein